MRDARLNIILKPQPRGGLTAYTPALPGCVSEGDSAEEARRNILDALHGYLTVDNKRSLTVSKSIG